MNPIRQFYRQQQAQRLEAWAEKLGKLDELYGWLKHEGITAERWGRICHDVKRPVTLKESEIVHLLAGWIGAPQTGLGIIEDPERIGGLIEKVRDAWTADDEKPTEPPPAG